MHDGRAGRPSSVVAGPSKLQSLVGGEGLKLLADGNATDRLLKTRQKKVFALPAVEIEQKRFHRPDSRRRQGQRTIPENGQRQCADRLRSEFPAKRDWLAVFLCLVGDVLKHAQDWRRKWIESFRDPRIAPVRCVQELHQVVGADREEIDPLE